jgi:tetratricopeptide (TPR) repeat protein
MYFGYKYRVYLMFWKYSTTEIETRFSRAIKTTDRDKRKELLASLEPGVMRYIEENPVSADSYNIAGELHFHLAEAQLPGTFSEMLVNDAIDKLDAESRERFVRVIREIKKAKALSGGEKLPMKYAMALARACYYTNHVSVQDIFGIIYDDGGRNLPEGIEDRRFYAFCAVMNRQEDNGIAVLKATQGNDSLHGILFLATVQRIAKKNTESIVSFKKALDIARDNQVVKLIRSNLGKIYFQQSLFRESIAEFMEVLKLDDKDISAKIWIGKNYKSLGEKDKAKSAWNEALALDSENPEARELLKRLQ